MGDGQGQFAVKNDEATAKDGSRLHAAVRDPDGNTIELYQIIK
jgi:catechol 2,3-dioxygenase-like lactoylglutathione lyase family enzyme